MPVAATEPAERQRFVREARSAAGLSHPNAVAVFDAGEADDLLYLVMEFVDGRTLADLLAEQGPFDPAQATEIITPVLAALGHAHAAGIVHRDVKPSNIMVSDDGTVKLLDFGIARRFDDLAGAITVEGQMVGTPKYLAPEQIEGGPVSPATDLYAVGVVLFEMLTGSVPFDGDSAVSTALARLHAPAPDVRTRRPDVPPALAAVVGKAMAREPADRFTDAAALQAAMLAGPQAVPQAAMPPKSYGADSRDGTTDGHPPADAGEPGRPSPSALAQTGCPRQRDRARRRSAGLVHGESRLEPVATGQPDELVGRDHRRALQHRAAQHHASDDRR